MPFLHDFCMSILYQRVDCGTASTCHACKQYSLNFQFHFLCRLGCQQLVLQLGQDVIWLSVVSFFEHIHNLHMYFLIYQDWRYQNQIIRGTLCPMFGIKQ